MIYSSLFSIGAIFFPGCALAKINQCLCVDSDQAPTASPTPTRTKSPASSTASLLAEASDRVSEVSLYDLTYKLDVPDKPDFLKSVTYSPIVAPPD